MPRWRVESETVKASPCAVETGDSTHEHSLFIGQLFVGDIQNTDWRTELRVCDMPVIFKLDTRAEVNVLPVSSLRSNASRQSNTSCRLRRY